MRSTQKVTIKAAVKKVSASENVYHEITITEKVKPKNSDDEIVERDWNKLYYPNDIDTRVKEDLIGKEVEVTIVFYPVKRIVGDQEFTNINCHIDSIEDIEGTE